MTSPVITEAPESAATTPTDPIESALYSAAPSVLQSAAVESVASSAASVAAEPVSAAASSMASTAAPSAAVSVAAGPPETYQWTVPHGVEVPKGLSERIATIARELGLNNEAGQKLFDAERTRIDTEAKANANGGAAWQDRVQQWTQESAADPELGGSPEKFAATVQVARRALDKYGSPEIVKFLDDTGFGAKKEVILLLAKIGRAMSESPTLVTGAPASVAPKSIAEKLYGEDGTGPKPST